MSASFVPGSDFESTERRLLSIAAKSPHRKLPAVLGDFVPASVGKAILNALGLSEELSMGRLERNDRRRLVRALAEWTLPVVDSRGYSFAEVTAGGIPLDEVDPSTMASRKCEGLYLVGEMLDVDGRIGGFNFQWAWSTGFIAGSAVASGGG
jgi:predicted Rossmann fold flavoprotein